MAQQRLPWWHWRKIPVAYLTAFLTLAPAAEGLALHQHLISPATAAWVDLALAFVGLVLGKKAHDASTPVADPKAADGTPLVPDPAVRATGPVG